MWLASAILLLPALWLLVSPAVVFPRCTPLRVTSESATAAERTRLSIVAALASLEAALERGDSIAPCFDEDRLETCLSLPPSRIPRACSGGRCTSSCWPPGYRRTPRPGKASPGTTNGAEGDLALYAAYQES
ncbi:hypothetical protein DSL92_08545 [Billgrantia gudaonensis]|uniref:Uncharacterized protein n=1 Tax=Billgrantia gudaonensis TaxID=376427 RepID=A0A3S0QFI9_9GAMM|nr:hypothetical protein DSL92_08545 [Halomonas gudaonensis]